MLLSQSASQSSQAVKSDDASSTDKLRAMTIRQLQRAVPVSSSQHFSVDGHEFRKISLVANAYIKMSDASRHTTDYMFNDGTGKISGYTRRSSEDLPSLDPFEYVFIIGELRRNDSGSLNVRVDTIRTLYDAHEIYFHLLQVVYEFILHEKGPPPPMQRRQRTEDCPIPSIVDQSVNQLTRDIEAVSLSDDSNDVIDISSPESLSSPLDREAVPLMDSDDEDIELSELEEYLIHCVLKASSVLAVQRGVDIGHLARMVKERYPHAEPVDIRDAFDHLILQKILDSDDNVHFAVNL